MSANARHADRERERGQIIVIFALALVAIVAMVGLVLDGGSAFAQRRDEQSAADLSALAAANAYMLDSDMARAHGSRPDRRRSQRVHPRHGWCRRQRHDHDRQRGRGAGRHQRAAPQQLRVGRRDADVAGRHDRQGAGRLSGHGQRRRADHLQHRRIRTRAASRWRHTATRRPFDFGESNGDIPTARRPCLDQLRDRQRGHQRRHGTSSTGTHVVNKTIAFGEYIGQHNNGNHTTLFDDMNNNLAGQNIPVPIVDHNGNFQGWATFHVTSAGAAPTSTSRVTSSAHSSTSDSPSRHAASAAARATSGARPSTW